MHVTFLLSLDDDGDDDDVNKPDCSVGSAQRLPSNGLVEELTTKPTPSLQTYREACEGTCSARWEWST
ncbi:hypothetical protein C0Q70_17321 [Pomacea canaliculata]|uniref:Uncharacterized protein n=1 Tax=Pomacea canaliculata TaxID=400727 RepID=A0A2T7NK30_POMCA|nr:hypothetical protein C0Q70_17321 [Pomacea canaliculata]